MKKAFITFGLLALLVTFVWPRAAAQKPAPTVITNFGDAPLQIIEADYSPASTSGFRFRTKVKFSEDATGYGIKWRVTFESGEKILVRTSRAGKFVGGNEHDSLSMPFGLKTAQGKEQQVTKTEVKLEYVERATPSDQHSVIWGAHPPDQR